MLRLRPFPALRPQPNLAAQVASLPYDVVNTAEARELTRDNPLSFLHVVRSEIDLPPGANPYSDAVYEKARENFDALIAQNVLVQDDEPRLFLYRQVFEHRAQIGVVGCCHIEDYLRNVIKKHEKTRQDKEDDRTRHTLALNANAGPVFLTYRDDASIDELVEHDMAGRPMFHFIAPDGVTHTVWPIANARPYVDAFAGIECAYVADGHHRSASAARAGAELAAQNPSHLGDEDYNWFLAVLFPASHLRILPYNRIIRDSSGPSGDEILQRLKDAGDVSETSAPSPERSGVFCVFVHGVWHRVEIDPATIDLDDPVASLDVSLLQDRVLEPIFGIVDQRTDPRIDFVGGIRGTAALEHAVRNGDATMAVSMHATTIEQLLAVSDAGLMMPPKSTWFEPKLRSGLLIHRLGNG